LSITAHGKRKTAIIIVVRIVISAAEIDQPAHCSVIDYHLFGYH